MTDKKKVVKADSLIILAIVPWFVFSNFKLIKYALMTFVNHLELFIIKLPVGRQKAVYVKILISSVSILII